MKKGFVMRADDEAVASSTTAMNNSNDIYNNIGSEEGGGAIKIYTARDVLNGRGQGVQRHPGNVKYRTLVYVNKVSFIYYSVS